MLRKKPKWLSSQAGRIAIGCAAALTLTLASSSSISRQDIVEFAGRNLNQDRWLASIVSAEGNIARDPRVRAVTVPLILNAEGKRISDADFNTAQSGFKGFIFTRTPRIARMLLNQSIARRDKKGDLPVALLRERAQMQPTPLKPGALYARSALFSLPDDALWPRVNLPKTQEPGQLLAQNAPHPLPRAKVAARLGEPLVLIPNAALAAIVTNAEAQSRAEKDAISVASIQNAHAVQNGYASNGDDPRAIFEAVLVRGDGKAELPQAPDENGDPFLRETLKEVPETPLAVTLDESPTIPIPEAKPEVVETLEPSVASSKKKQHFWAAFKLPGSVYRKSQQRCLAAGIYFEARGEPEEGQAAVAQVILNRVKAPTYPDSICGVVYQNQHLRNRCQFSFACDGVYDRIRDKKAWERAVRIARDVSRGKIYLDKVADSTHYHAEYVHPNWRSSMKVVDKIGVHIFYRSKSGGWY